MTQLTSKMSDAQFEQAIAFEFGQQMQFSNKENKENDDEKPKGFEKFFKKDKKEEPEVEGKKAA